MDIWGKEWDFNISKTSFSQKLRIKNFQIKTSDEGLNLRALKTRCEYNQKISVSFIDSLTSSNFV